MVDQSTEELPLPTRVALLEARVRLIALVLKWLVGGLVTTLVAAFLKW